MKPQPEIVLRKLVQVTLKPPWPDPKPCLNSDRESGELELTDNAENTFDLPLSLDQDVKAPGFGAYGVYGVLSPKP